MNAAAIPRRAHALRAAPGWRRPGCRRTTRSTGASAGRSSIDATVSIAEDRAAVAVGRVDLALVALAQDVVQRDEAELARMARRARDDDTARVEQRAHLLDAARVARPRDLDERVDRDRAAVDDDQRVDVDRDDVGLGVGERAQAEDRRDERVAVDRGLAAERPEQRLGLQLVDHLVRVDPFERHEPEAHVRDRLGQDPAEADHHAATELRVGVHAGDQLAGPAHHRRDEQLDRRRPPGSRRPSSASAASRDRTLVAQVEAHQAALGLVGDGVAAELHHDREPELRRPRRPRRRRSRRCARAAPGTPNSASRRFERASERVVGGHRPPTLAIQTAWVRSLQCSSRSTRLRSLPASVRGQLVAQLVAPRPLVPRDARRDERLEVGEVELARHLRLDDAVDALAPLVVRDAEHRDVEDTGVLVDDRLDLGRVDVHAARDDHVLLAVADVEVALLVRVRDVADGLPPALFVLAQLLVGAVVAVHREPGGHEQLAALARSRRACRRPSRSGTRCRRTACRTSPACAAGPRDAAR